MTGTSPASACAQSSKPNADADNKPKNAGGKGEKLGVRRLKRKLEEDEDEQKEEAEKVGWRALHRRRRSCPAARAAPRAIFSLLLRRRTSPPSPLPTQTSRSPRQGEGGLLAPASNRRRLERLSSYKKTEKKKNRWAVVKYFLQNWAD